MAIYLHWLTLFTRSLCRTNLLRCYNLGSRGDETAIPSQEEIRKLLQPLLVLPLPEIFLLFSFLFFLQGIPIFSVSHISVTFSPLFLIAFIIFSYAVKFTCQISSSLSVSLLLECKLFESRVLCLLCSLMDPELGQQGQAQRRCLVNI